MKNPANPPVLSGGDLLEAPGIAKPREPHFDWILSSAFWVPAWQFSSAHAEHLPLLFWLVDAMRPRVIVDLVAGSPDAYLAFCQAVDRLDCGAKCTGLSDVFSRRSSDNDPASLLAYHNLHFGQFSNLANRGQIIELSGPKTVDLLRIDGRQASQFSGSEARACLDMLSSNGLILIEQPQHLQTDWLELLKGKASCTLNGGVGLRLIAATSEYERRLSPLFSESSAGGLAKSMRLMFSRLGSALHEQAMYRDTASFATRLEVSLADRSAAVDLLHEQTNELQDELARLTPERDGLLARVAALEPDVEQFRTEAIRLQKLVSEYDLELRRRSEELLSANQYAVLQNERLEQSVQSQDELRRQVSRLEHDINAITRSTTWRVTAPVRMLMQSFPRTARLFKRGLKLLWWTVSLELFSRLRERHRLRQPAHVAMIANASIVGSPPATAPDANTGAVNPLRRTLTGTDYSSTRIQYVENQVAELSSILDLERRRVDYALLGVDGLSKEIELYHNARGQAEYRKAFEEAAPLVSICVATMNRSDLLIERCLKSLLSQSYRNIQIVVCGDHCTDDTGSRVAQLRDDRILFRNLPVRGPYPPPGIDRWRVAGTNAINAALSMCEGQFIAHLDDDDSATVDRIETMLNAAQVHKADFCWHSFWNEHRDGGWHKLGDGRLELGQVTTGSTFYHRYFKRIPWDVFAYRSQEPGDWNRLRKIRSLRPKLHFVDRPLMFHYTEGNQSPFVQFDGETFLE